MRKAAHFVVFLCGVFLALFVPCAWGDVKINAANFPDPVFRTYASQCDTGWEVMDSDGYRHIIGEGDGILAAQEVRSIDRFITNGVSSFKGLNFFPKLTSLYALYNNLTEFDASGNPALISIDVNGNQLTSLNVRSNGALQSLVCSDNNLTQLNVSGNSRLRFLFCQVNPLGSINISGNPNLEIIDCSYNDLTELNVQNNSQLRTLTCSNNKLAALNTSGNPKLRELYCWDNPIGSINLRNNTNLEILDCRETGITELDLSNQKALKTLSCQNNALKELDLSGCTSLKNVYCENQRATGLTYKLTAEGYEINLKDLVSNPDNIDVTSLTENASFLRYDGVKKTVLLNYRPQSFYYRYNTHSPKNHMMSVNVKFSMNTAVIERNGPTQNIIYGLNDKNYLDYSGKALTESSISGYSDRQYGMKGLAADGNSRLIVRVQTNRPGNVAFSFKDDIGATLEKLTDRTKITASTPISATKLNTEFYQASAVIVAPERFPEKKKFPEDKFKLHVKFTADETDEKIPEEEKIIEEDIELEIQAAPVVLLHGFSGGANAESTFGINENIGVYRKLKDAKFNVSWWNYDGTKGPSVLLRNDYNGLFSTLVLAFEEYRQKGIVCTKADIVGYSMGGLVARYFCLPQQASYDGNYYTFRSYKQGMVRRIVDIAVPNKGSPWASYFCKDFSVINTNINFMAMSVSGWLMIAEPVIKKAVEQFMNGGRNSDSAWEDMAINSAVTGGAYPVNVPMYSIYGQVKRDIDNLMKVVDFVKFIKTGGQYAAKYSGTDEYINYMEKFKDDLDLADSSLAMFSYAAPVHPLFTSILQAVQLALSTSPAGIVKSLTEQLPTVINEAFFANDEHDLCVSKNSAAGDMSSASLGRTGFFQYNHLAICKQNDIGNDVVSKLKGPKSAFKVFTQLSSSKSALPSAKSALPSNAGNDGEYNADIAYAENFKIQLEPSTLNVKGGNATLKIKATSSKKITEGANVYIVIQKDGLDRIFTAYGTDGKNFTKSIEFTSADAGSAKVYCFSYGEGEQLYISNKTQLAIKANANDSDIEELYFADESGVRFAESGSEIAAGLYARTKDGTVFDVSSTAMGTVWDSSNYAVAYVDDDGIIHALIEGTSVLTAKYAGKTARISVNVGNRIWGTWITTTELDGGKKGREYHAELIASGSAPLHWKLSGGMLPAGLEFSSSGIISGVPEEEGEFSFTVEVSNTAGSNSRNFKLKIGGSAAPDITTGAELPTVSRRQKYSVKLVAEGSGVSWILKDGAIPEGLSFVESGEITGTPTKAGEYTFTLKAVNSSGEDTRTFTLKVTQTAVTGSIPANVTRRATYTGTPKASGGASPYVWSISAGKLPDGLKINSSTGKITGSATKAGTFNFTVKAKDKNGAAGTKAYTVKVTQTAVTGTIPATTTRRATFNATPKASGGTSPYVWSISAGKLPDGLKLNTSTGKITGSATKAGTFNFTVKAKDKNGAAGTKAYTVKVTQTAVTGTIPATTTRRATFTATPKASGGASPYKWSISAGKLPDGLKLNTSTGKITGSATKAGTFNFTVKAKDKNGAAGTKAYTVKVTQTAVTGTIPATTTRRATFTGTPKASGGASPYVWSISAGKLPDGLKLNTSTGKITGSATKAGMFNFTVKAKDKNGAAGTKAYTVKVTQTAVTGTISATTTRRATFTATPKASGGASPYKWSISAGKLPDGLKLNTSTGKITGSATKAGTFNFTVKAKDKNGAAGTKAYTVKVTQTAVTGTIPATTTRRATFTGTPKASGGASPYVWSISAGKLPDGLKLNTSTGKITGSATKAGTFNFTVKAKDKNGAAGTKAYTVKVTQTTVAGTLANAVKGTSYTATPKASNGASPYVWSVSSGSLPTGLKLNTSTGKITGTPSKTGSYTFTIKAKDKNGAAATKNYTVKVTTATTAKSSLPETKSDTTNAETLSAQGHNTVSSLPALQEQTHESDSNTATAHAISLRVISDDILESHEARDSDIFTVKAGKPATFILGGKISGAIVCIDDEAAEGITISDDGTFTLPAEFVYGDFKVNVKSSDGTKESEEAFIISE